MLTVPPDFPYNPWAKVGLGGWHYSNCLFLRVTKHKIINIWNFGTHKENQTAPSLQEKRSLRPLTRDTNRWDNKWIARSRTNTNWWAWLKIDDLVEWKLALWTGSHHHHNLDLSSMGLWGCVQSKAQTWRKKSIGWRVYHERAWPKFYSEMTECNIWPTTPSAAMFYDGRKAQYGWSVLCDEVGEACDRLYLGVSMIPCDREERKSTKRMW